MASDFRGDVPHGPDDRPSPSADPLPTPWHELGDAKVTQGGDDLICHWIPPQQHVVGFEVSMQQNATTKGAPTAPMTEQQAVTHVHQYLDPLRQG